MAYGIYLKLRFKPPLPLDEYDFNITKQLQNEGIKKIKYLKVDYRFYVKVYGTAYIVLSSLWCITYIINRYSDNSVTPPMQDGCEAIMFFVTIPFLYSTYQVLWELVVYSRYNRDLYKLISQSEHYTAFIKHYKSLYGR